MLQIQTMRCQAKTSTLEHSQAHFILPNQSTLALLLLLHNLPMTHDPISHFYSAKCSRNYCTHLHLGKHPSGTCVLPNQLSLCCYCCCATCLPRKFMGAGFSCRGKGQVWVQWDSKNTRHHEWLGHNDRREC